MAKQKPSAKTEDGEREQSVIFVPKRDSKCAACLSHIDPTPETLAANPDLSDEAGNIFCTRACKRRFTDGSDLEAWRRQVAGTDLTAFAGGMGLAGRAVA